MTIQVAPNRIELSDLQGGFSPDAAEAAVPLNASPDVLNLLPEPWGTELRLRHGFTRLSAGRINSLSASHWIRHVNYYEVSANGSMDRYLVCILTNGAAAANNVQVWVYNLEADTFTRVDTAGRTWANPEAEHWFAVIEGTYYGGTRGELPYSWHPTGGWDATPTTPSADTWVDSTSPGAGELARNYAFKKGTVVLYSGSYYKAARGIRYKTWESGQRYSKGEKVSRKASESGTTYWRSFECIKSHTAGADSDEPGTGANTATYWKRVRLSNILDADSDLTDDWYYSPGAPKGIAGAYHGNRLFGRRDQDGINDARLQYSAPAKPERDALIADLTFDPTDWTTVPDIEGDGGGWLDIPFGGRADSIQALLSYGNYLIIAGRWQSMVLSGTNPQTWTLRQLSHTAGAFGPQAIAEMDGLVYMLGRSGELFVTDGTTAQPVPGLENIRKWLKAQMDQFGDQGRRPSLVPHDGRLYISLPDTGGTNYTLVYDPRTQSFWLLDLPIMDMANGEVNGAQRLYFATVITGATGQRPCVFKLTDDPGNEAYVDDDDEAVSGTASTLDISWRWRSAWFQYGTTRNERRIRRVWALLGGEAASSVIVRVFKNFVAGSSSYVTTVTRTLTGQATQDAEFVEGSVGQTGHTAYATGVRLSGTANAVVSLHGVGIDTEPVRTRFHR